MKAEYMEPFISAAFSVLQSLTGDKPTRGQISLRMGTFASDQVTILAGVSGQVEGIAMYGMSSDTAKKIAGTMIGTDVPELDEMAISALAELGNMVTGNAITLLSQRGYDVDITPPSVIKGEKVEVSTKVPALVIPVILSFGKIDINVALGENMAAGKKAA